VFSQEHLDFVDSVELNTTFDKYALQRLNATEKVSYGYAVVLQGTVHLNATASYTFNLGSVDGSGITLQSNNTGQVFELENDGLHEYLVKTKTASLDEGDYDFMLTSFHRSGSFRLSLSVGVDGGPAEVLRAATTHGQNSVSTEYPHSNLCEKDRCTVDPCKVDSASRACLLARVRSCSDRGQCNSVDLATRKRKPCTCDVNELTGKLYAGFFCQKGGPGDEKEGVDIALAIVYGVIAVSIPGLMLLAFIRGHKHYASCTERRRLRRKADEAIEVMQARTHALTHSRTHSRTHALTHSRTHSLTHSRTHSLTHSRMHSLTHARTHARTHSLTHVRTHSLTHALTHARTHALTHARTHARTHSRTHSRTHALTHPLATHTHFFSSYRSCSGPPS
jgi:hypothetical protein